MPIQSTISSFFSRGKRSALNISNQIAQIKPKSLPTATALTQLQDTVHGIERALNDPSATVEEFAVTRPDGALLAWFGTRVVRNKLFSGFWTDEAYIGPGGPDQAPFFCDGSTVIIGKNGQVFIQDMGGNNAAWLGVTSETPRAITGASGASPSVVTLAAHGFVNGDTIVVRSNAGTFYSIVENATTNTFTMTDLDGVPVSGSGWFSGATTAERFYAGLLAQTVAIGKSFGNYKLRAFADGNLAIKNASIVIESVVRGHTTTVTISPDQYGGIDIRYDTDTRESIFDAGGVAMYSTTGRQTLYMDSFSANDLKGPHSLINLYAGDETLQFQAAGDGSVYATALQVRANYMNPGDIGLDRDLTAGRNVIALGFVNSSNAFRIGGAPGVSGSLGISVSTGTITFAAPGGGTGSATVVTGVSLTPNLFSGGIRVV